MTDTSVVNIALHTILLATKLAAPILVVTMVIGLGVSIVQSATQIQEFTLTFVPKLAGVGIVLLVAGNWMLGELVAFTEALMRMLPELLR